MATTPHPPPKPEPPKPPPPPHVPAASAHASPPPAATKPGPAGAAPGQHHAVLAPDQALSLFRNGHRIALDGDPQDNWISMGVAIDGKPLYQQPLTQALVDTIMAGSYYVVDDQAYLTPEG